VTISPDIAYACDATSGISTLDQTYDRRGWVLLAAAKSATTRILLQGWICDSAIDKAGQCTDEPGGNALLRTAPLPPAISLDLAGLPIRGAPLNRERR
jgi:hypothetical protein